jgi:hypothetical protein
MVRSLWRDIRGRDGGTLFSQALWLDASVFVMSKGRRLPFSRSQNRSGAAFCSNEHCGKFPAKIHHTADRSTIDWLKPVGKATI